MNKKTLSERDICTKFITPAIEKSGWDRLTQLLEEVSFTDGKIYVRGKLTARGARKRADYILYYKPNIPIAIVEAKDNKHSVRAGIQQALDYAKILDIPCVFSSNGDGFVFHDRTATDGNIETELNIDGFPTPEELWQKYKKYKGIKTPEAEKVVAQEYYFDGSGRSPRYYQQIAVNRTVEAIAKGQDRILLVMATGTGKTYTAFQIIHRLWKSGAKKRILFLADRNALIDQTRRGDFKHFKDKMTVVKNRMIDKSYEVYLALYQGLSGADDEANAYKQFSPEFFDLIVIDECHRGSAKEDSAWREILTYFKKATHIGLTATPKETNEVSNSEYFGDPLYTYSLKQGIEEGFIRDVLENYTTYQSYYALLKKVEDDPAYDKLKAQKKLKIYVESHEHAIAKKTALVVDHFMDTVIRLQKINGLGKAMLVTSSRKNAVKYKKAFDKYLAETNNPYKAIVAFSGEIDGETESSLNHFSSGDIPEQFKKSEYRFLIVANKYQTGFDQPLLHTMYVDKKLGGVNAVQTLSRLNRTTAGKDDTFVLDFANTAEEIKKSFDPFYETTILGEATDPNKLFDLQNALDNFQVYTPEQVQLFSQKIVENVTVDQLHIILDEAANTFRTTLSEEQQEDFRVKCKSYVRLYVFLAQIVPFVNPYLERLYIFLKHLQNKIGKQEGEDLAKGILDNIDMDSYRLQKEGEFRIQLEQGDELKALPTELRGTAAEPELEYLSNIVKAFNDKFGTTFTNEDKVRKMTEELMQDVADDQKAMDNINASLEKHDFQNAEITFTDVLKEKMVNHIESNFEVFKEYNDNPEFRAFLANQMFQLMLKDFSKLYQNRK